MLSLLDTLNNAASDWQMLVVKIIVLFYSCNSLNEHMQLSEFPKTTNGIFFFVVESLQGGKIKVAMTKNCCCRQT